MKTNLLIAANLRDAKLAQREVPRYRSYLVVTPRSVPKGIVIGEYVWTPRRRCSCPRRSG